jgi:hypothetical protein
LRLEAGKQFAPDLVEPFIQALNDENVGSSVGGQIMLSPLAQTQNLEVV